MYYAEEIEQEAPHELPESRPPAPWPSQGGVEFKDVVLKYRPELPSVLKSLSAFQVSLSLYSDLAYYHIGISINVKAGEKIGIVGRYVKTFLRS